MSERITLVNPYVIYECPDCGVRVATNSPDSVPDCPDCGLPGVALEFVDLGEFISAESKAEIERLRRVVEVARNLAVTLHRHNEQTALRHRLGDDADLADDEGYCCEICCEVGDLLYDLGQALGEIGIDDLSKIPDLRDLAKLDMEHQTDAAQVIHRPAARERPERAFGEEGRES